MKKLSSGAIGLVAIIGLILLLSSAFIIDPTKQAFITQFGKPVGDAVSEPGIHFKLPFIQKIRFFDKRFLEWDGNPNRVPTRDKRYISIDTYARWRIKDPLTFFEKVNDETGAQSRLDDILDGATRSAIANHDLIEIVRSKKRTDRQDAVTIEGDEIDLLPDFQVGRGEIAMDVLRNARTQLEPWGIELLDVRFKRIMYEEDVKRKIFERMISERMRIAEKFRSEGEGEAAKIGGQRERELKTIASEAYRQSQEIEGKADAEAVSVYAASYDQSPETREFYRFMKTMETYETSLSTQDWLILSTETDFYQFLRSANPSK